ncbi:hypothetical protein FA95DRAFT_1517530 [Auriscalpium vulgare]|uniref:Uncharacterized protein n=1 Tax=Auriscalpium vulgare TaxID=40419 RepID=A0ACB8RWQ1_9AGAM|nr:hypothetical protein FA95DRAFT_1517530 [Auriscalpium vulgare]
MDMSNGSPSFVQKQEDIDGRDASVGGKDVKPATKTLNRVPRACNACRKQKMRCEGADNPPCRRCRHAGLECMFEKPSREASLTGEAGLERIRSLESHVADIRQTQSAIQSTLLEIVGHLRGGSAPPARSPTSYPQPYMHHSPSIHSDSPALSTPSTARPPQMGEPGHSMMPPPQPGSNSMYPSPTQPHMRNPNESHMQAPGGQYQAMNAPYQIPPGMHPPMLPPISSMEPMGPPRPQHTNVSSVRHQYGDSPHQSRNKHLNAQGGSSVGTKRSAPPSNVTSADSSDVDEDDGELPASGLVAPWEVLRGLADVAILRAAKESGESSEPQSRTRTPSPDPGKQRPVKRRKVHHRIPRSVQFPDVVSKNIISEADARELFRIYYHGCSTFLPVFDSSVDTYESLHERSPFAVDSICMVAAKVRDGGGKSSEEYEKCLAEVQAISCATLFSPVMRQEAVQAMILVSGWSDNGWLSGGHAVRMALELSMHKAWPRLLRRMEARKASDGQEDRELVVAARTWFCLYLFEHQMSYGTGRPAILKDDESIWQCRLLLRHPLALEDDMRLVSTVELMAIRERITNLLAPFAHGPVDERTFEVLRTADAEFKHWYTTWDQAFSQKYEDAAFYRQSLQLQHLHAELYHSASALRGINGPEDMPKMLASQRDLAIRSIKIAQQGLDITVNSHSYREGMKYAVHYTHATATFMASFLLRLARLFPNECNMKDTRDQVELLASLMSEIPGKRYALTLQLMLKRSKKRTSGASRSPKLSREQYHQKVPVERPSGMAVSQVVNPTPISPTTHYDVPAAMQGHSHGHGSVPPPGHYAPQHHGYVANAEHIWRGFEATASEQLPVWLSDQSLGGNSFTQSGIDAFLLPNDYLPPAPQIW